MSIYHRFDPLATPAAIRFREFAQEWLAREPGARCDLRSLEQQAQAAAAGMVREVMTQALASLDVECERIEVKGQVYEKAYRTASTYYCLSGEIHLERNLYQPAESVGRSSSICPLDLRCGIVEGTWTPAAAEVMAHAVAVMTPYEAEEFLLKIGGFTPSRSSLERLPKALSGRWEARRQEWEAAIRAVEVIPGETSLVSVSLDGVMTPMKDGQRIQKREQSRAEGRETRGPAGFRESGCGTVSFHNQEGERLRTVFFARMPESKKVTLHQQLAGELCSVKGLIPDLDVVMIADGAKENWRILGEMASRLAMEGVLGPGSRIWEIVDIYHANQHLKKVTDLYYGQDTPRSFGEFEKLRRILKEEPDGVERIIKKLTYYRNRCRRSRRAQLTTEVRYFRKHRARMRYHDYQCLKLPIGSGVVEAACKTLVTQRLKRSGMRWTIRGGQGVLTLRALLKSGRWDAGWGLLSGSYRAEIRMVKPKGHLRLISLLPNAA